MNKKAFPIWYFSTSNLYWWFFKLPFTQQTCQRMTIQCPFKKNYCLDITIWEFSIISKHLPFKLGCKQILHQLLVLRILVTLNWYPWVLRPSFVMLKFPDLWILQRSWIVFHNVYHLGAQLDLCTPGVSSPIQHSSNDRCPSARQNVLLCSYSLLHRSPLSYFWLFSDSTPDFFKLSSFFVHRCFRCRNFHCLRQRNKFVYHACCTDVVNCHLFL